MRRINITKQDWYELIKEFDFRCVRCGLKEYHLDKDHIIPFYQGGSINISNIQPICAWCNSSKGAENFKWKLLCTKLPKSHPYNKI